MAVALLFWNTSVLSWKFGAKVAAVGRAPCRGEGENGRLDAVVASSVEAVATKRLNLTVEVHAQRVASSREHARWEIHRLPSQSQR